MRRDLLYSLLVFAFAVIAGVIWVAVSARTPTSDALTYYTLASNIAQGRGYLLDGSPTAFWNPGYPLALAGVFALFGASLTTMLGAEIALHAVSAVLAYVLGLKLGLSRAVASAVGLLAAVYPDKLYFLSRGAADSMAVPLVLGILLCWIAVLESDRHRLAWIAAVGALLGCLILTRTVAQVLPLLLVPLAWVMLRRRGVSVRDVLAHIAVMLCICLAVLSPWLVRNARVFGSPMLTTNGGTNLLIALASEPPGSFQLDALGTPPPTAVDEVGRDREYLHRAVGIMRSTPERWPRAMLANARGLFVTPASQSDMGVALNVLSALFVPIRMILVGATAAWFFLGRPPRTDAIESTSALCLTWMLAHVLLAPMGSVRFTVPVMLPMLILSIALLFVLVARRRAAVLPPRSSDC